MQNKKTVFAMVIALSGNTLINYLTGILVDKFGTRVYLYVITFEIIAMAIVFVLIRASEKKTTAV
ncbi:MAG: hypothetical protein ACOX19_05380 [Fermentimonas sp.]|jgi:F0F1-type ATP synthase assembly protein I